MKQTTKDNLYAAAALALMLVASTLDYYWSFGG